MAVHKKGLAFLLILTTLLLSLNVTAIAGYQPVDPYFVNISSFQTAIMFNGSCGTLSASTIGRTGTTKITGSVVLDRLNSNGTYTQIASWNNLSANGNYFDFSQTYYVTTGYTYRLTFTTTVYINGVGETATGSASQFAQ